MNVFAWIGVGIVTLLVVTLAYVGMLYLTRSVHISRISSLGDNAAEPHEKEFPRLISLLTGADLAEGHKVEVFTCGDDTYPRLWADMRSAERSLTVQMYYCQPGTVADQCADILVERARAGVKVHFMRDGFGGQNLSEEYLQRLEDAGVKVATFRPTRWYELHKIHHRSHIRVVCIDGRIGYTGGFGLDDKWLGDGRHEGQWRDSTVRFEGPAVHQLQATFAAGWCEAAEELLTAEVIFPPEPPEREGGMCAGTLHAAPTVGSTPAERYFALAIGASRKSLYITNSYFVPTDELCTMLQDAARRGVDVRILTPGPNSDVISTYYAGRSMVEGLLRAGVRFYEYEPSMLHAKTVVVDGVWSAVGTVNFDNRSLAFNDEVMLFVYDREFGAHMEKVYHEDLAYSKEVTLEMHLARPLKGKLLERFYSLFYRLL